MSDYNPVSSEKGFALILALLMTATLLLMAVALHYSMASYLRMFATSKEKTQTYYTAVAGVEELRDYLWTTNSQPGNGWNEMLATAATDSSYQNKTGTVKSDDAHPENPIFPHTNNVYHIYFRDNEDGDNTYASDNDQIVLASITAENPDDGTKTTVEAMLIYKNEARLNDADYSQQGFSASRSSRARAVGPSTAELRQTM